MFLKTERGNPKIQFELSCNYSPVDFLVAIWRLDPDKMSQGVRPPYKYVKSHQFDTLDYHEVVTVESNQWSAKIDVLRQALDLVLEGIYSVTGLESGNPEFRLPTLEEDSVYIIRAFSGGWKDHMKVPTDDYVDLFQVPESKQLWTQALALNVTMALLDAWQLAATGEVTAQRELVKLCLEEAIAHTITGIAEHDIASLETRDAIRLFFELSLIAGHSFCEGYYKNKIKSEFDDSIQWSESSKKLRETVELALGRAVKFLTALEKASSIGRIAERALGLSGYIVASYGLELANGPSPMETTFLVVGDPFSPIVESCPLTRAPAGAVVEFTGKRFHTTPERNEVTFNNQKYKAEVLSVSKDGTQISIRIPKNATGSPAFSTTRALRAVLYDAFVVVAPPALTSVSEKTHLPTSTNPSGKPYHGLVGDTVELEGSNLLPKDDVTQVELYLDEQKIDTLSVHEENRISFTCPSFLDDDAGWRYPKVYLRYKIGDSWFETERQKVTVVAAPYISQIAASVRPGQQVMIQGLGLDAGFKIDVEGHVVEGRLLESTKVCGVFTMPSLGISGERTVSVEIWNAAGSAQKEFTYVPECTEVESPAPPSKTSRIPVNSFSDERKANGLISLGEALAAARGELSFWINGYDDYDEEWTENWVEVLVPDSDPPSYEWEHHGYVSQETTTNNSIDHEVRYIYRQYTDRNGKVTGPTLVNTVDLDTGEGEYVREEGDLVTGGKPGVNSADTIEALFNGLDGQTVSTLLSVARFDRVSINAGGCTIKSTGGKISEAATVGILANVELGAPLTVTGIGTQFSCDGRLSGQGVLIDNLHGGWVSLDDVRDVDGDAVKITGSSSSEVQLTATDCTGWGIWMDESECMQVEATVKNCEEGGGQLTKTRECSLNLDTENVATGLLFEETRLCRAEATIANVTAGITIHNGRGNSLEACSVEQASTGLLLYETESNEIHLSATSCLMAAQLENGAAFNMLYLNTEGGSSALKLKDANTKKNFVSLSAKNTLKDAVLIEDATTENIVTVNLTGEIQGNAVTLSGYGTSQNKITGSIGSATSTISGKGVFITNYADENTVSATINGCKQGGIDVDAGVVNTQIEECVIGNQAPNGDFGIRVQKDALGTMLVSNTVDRHNHAAVHLNNVRDDSTQSMAIYGLSLSKDNALESGEYGLYLENCAGVYIGKVRGAGGFDVGMFVDGDAPTRITGNDISLDQMKVSGLILSGVTDSTFNEVDTDSTGTDKKAYFQKQNPATVSGITLEGCERLSFTGMSASNNEGIGLKIDGCEELRIEGMSTHNAQDGVKVDTTRNLTVPELFLYGNTQHGFNAFNASTITFEKVNTSDNLQWALYLDACMHVSLESGAFYAGGAGGVYLNNSNDIAIGGQAIQSVTFAAEPEYQCISATKTQGLVVLYTDFMSVETGAPLPNPITVPLIYLEEVTDSQIGPQVWGHASPRFLCSDDLYRTVFDIHGDCSGLLIRQTLMAAFFQQNQNPPESPMDHGVVLGDGATGVALLGNYIVNANSSAILMEEGAHENILAHNRVQRGQRDGVLVTGNGTAFNRITENRITNNAMQGIALESDGNNEISAPVIEYADLSTYTLAGRIEPAPPTGSRVEVYADPEDEGVRFLGDAPVRGNNFSINTPFPEGQRLHAITLHPDGNTSEFGPMHIVDPPSDTFAFFYATQNAANDDIWFYDPRYQTPMPLTQDPARDYMPTVASQRRGLVFISERSGNPDLWLMYFDGRSPVQLTATVDAETDPALFGDRLAFSRNEEGRYRLYVGPIQFETGAAGPFTTLSTTEGNDRYPCWSSDGSKLFFASDRSGDWDIWSVNADASAAQNLTHQLSGVQSRPACSKLSEQILFLTDTGAVWTMNADGSDAASIYDAVPLLQLTPTTLPGKWLCAASHSETTEIGVFNSSGQYTTLLQSQNDLVDPILAPASVTRELEPEVVSWIAYADAGVSNQAPTLTLVETVVGHENSLLTFIVQASDPDGDVITLSARNLPPGATFDAATGVFSWTPSEGDAGTYGDVVFYAADDGVPALQVQGETTITIRAATEGENEGESEGELEGEYEGEDEGESEGEYEGINEGELEGEGEGENDPCCGCSERCGCCTVDDAKQWFRYLVGDLFIYALSLITLLLFSRRWML